MHDKIVESITALTEWLKTNHHAATKEDLRQAEDRILKAIQGEHIADQARLDAITAKATWLAAWITAIAKNLAQLDASTPENNAP